LRDSYQGEEEDSYQGGEGIPTKEKKAFLREEESLSGERLSLHSNFLSPRETAFKIVTFSLKDKKED